MKLCDFEGLTVSKQAFILAKDGIYIGKRKLLDTSIILYQLDSFYVEIYYSVYRKKIKKIYCFTSTIVLDPYLEQISLMLFV